MEKDIKIKKFILYLNKIGLLTEEDNQLFLNNIYQLFKNNVNSNGNSLDKQINQKYLEENIIKALLSFLNSLTEEKNKIISLNIYKNFLSEENNLSNKKGLKIYKLYQKLKIRIFFKKWLILTNNLTNNNNKYKPLLNDILEETNNNTISYNISNVHNPSSTKNLTYTYTINNNSYNSSYNISPKNIPNNNLNNSNHIINLKTNNNKYINPTRNHEYNLNALNINGKLIDSKTNKTINSINKIMDNKKSYTFTNDYSFYNNNNKESQKEKKNNFDYYRNKLLSGGAQLFNKKGNITKKNKNKLNLKLKAHFEYLGNLSKSQKDHKLIREKTTEYIKEEEELKNNCTFKPKINNYKTPKAPINKIKYNNILRTEQLYLDNQKRMAKRNEEILIRDNKISKENTFKPKFISSSVKKLKRNFSLRLFKYNKLKEEKLNKIINTIETDFNSIYTFSPKLNLSYNNKNLYNSNSNDNNNDNNNNINTEKNPKKTKIPAYQRLYNDNKEKMIRQEERKNQVMEDILIKANNPINYNNLNDNNNNLIKSVDYQKLEELYNDYKKKKIKIKEKQEHIDNEIGITFNPILINGEKYANKIEPNFLEREKKFVENQKNRIEAYRNYLIKERERNKKEFSGDKKIIIKNVVDRLYKEGLEKVLIRNNTKPNIFSKNYSKNEKKEYDGNETIYVNQSILKIESIKSDKNKNLLSGEIKMGNSNDSNSNLIKTNIKTSIGTNDNLSLSKDNNNLVEQLPLMMNSK